MEKVLKAVIYLLVALVLVVAGFLVLPAYRKYQRTKQEVVDLQAELDRENDEYLRRQKEVHDLQHNAFAIEKVAREQYHLCRDGETIYIYSASE